MPDTTAMLTTEEVKFALEGATIEDAEVRNAPGRQVLRLRLANGHVVAISADGNGLSMADETSIH